MALYGGIELPDRPDPENVRRLDLLPLPMVRAMQRYGFRIDPEHFSALSSRLTARMRDLRKDITSEIPPEALDRFVDAASVDDEGDNAEESEENDVPQLNVESSQKIAALLYGVLGLDKTAGVRIKKTGSGDRLSTGKKTLEQLKREHPVVQLILDYREASKLNGTYAVAMPRRARRHLAGSDCPLCGGRHRREELRVHTTITTTRAITGRTASKDPNLANIPARSELGREIRAGFIASTGYIISQRDFAQIELRLGADRSGDDNMLRVFYSGGDIHVDTAMRAFDKSEEEVTHGRGKILYRAPCKNVNFAVFYGITEDGLLDLMAATFATAGEPMPEWMDKRWCAQFIAKWFTLYPGIKRYLDAEEEKARRYGIVWTAAGRVRRIPNVRSYHGYIQSAGVREGANHGIQGYSADIMKLAMGELWERLDLLRKYGIKATPLITVYDELLVEAEEDDAETVQQAMAEVMDGILVDKQTGRLRCRVPIKSDGKLMERWVKE